MDIERSCYNFQYFGDISHIKDGQCIKYGAQDVPIQNARGQYLSLPKFSDRTSKNKRWGQGTQDQITDAISSYPR